MLAFAGTRAAQTSRSSLRTARAKVVDELGKSLPSAIVYLHNLRTQAVHVYVTRQSGLYRFSGLHVTDDYQVHAEHGDLTSDTYTIFHLDSRREFIIDLKVDKKKPLSPGD
jgi:hypothetical protein